MQTHDTTERVTVTLPGSQVRALRRLARANNQSVSGVMRHAVTAFLRAPVFILPSVHSDTSHESKDDYAGVTA